MKLRKPPATVDFPKLEATVQRRWEKDGTFQQSLSKNQKNNRFTFYDGPPFATGLPHYGHLLQSTIKDIIPRFKTMQGYYVERRWGWDCHGLPVEYELEKQLKLGGRQEILEMGVDTFNEACRAIVLRHTAEWESTINRLGRWIDLKNDYKTMDPGYMEAIWRVVKALWEKGLLYEGYKAVHICPRCATPLSNFEVSQNYQDRQDPAVYVAFPLKQRPEVSLLAWTTTPWTLPANVLLAINPDVVYAEVRTATGRYIAAEERLEDIFDTGSEGYELLRTIDAAELAGLSYEPPFPAPGEGIEGTRYEVVTDAAVTATEGTGILHVAPAFGAEDLAICTREGAAFIQHVDITGTITEVFPPFSGQGALEANKGLVAELKRMKRLYRAETITHSYPHCWRCDTPLLNYATASWFVAVSKVKQLLLSENQQVAWMPEHVRDGRFGQWLENATDWAVSRNRFWGNPLPIWRCENGHVTVVGSLDELEAYSGQRPADLHKHFVDPISFPCPQCDGPAERIPEILDCWFESGSMPYTQHDAFGSPEEFRRHYPADFIAEALDQTRGWFYTLHVLGVALTGSRAFKHVITTGLVLAEDGKKMSKSLQNYPEPGAVLERYGADALRLYLVSSPIVRGDNLRFAESGVAEMARTFNGTVWNSYCFLTTYAGVDGWEVTPPPAEPVQLMDRWILSRLQTVVSDVTSSLERYDLMPAARSLTSFLDELSNWYIRRSRRRFWKSTDDADKHEAYATLHHVLVTFCQLAAPFTPMVADELYGQLTGDSSVHLSDWPIPEPTYAYPQLEARMAAAREVVSLGLAARSEAGIRLRQPLAEVRIVDHTGELEQAKQGIIETIAEELNVKAVRVLGEDAETARDFVRETLAPVPELIGPVLGSNTQAVITATKAGEYEVIDDEVLVAGHRLPAASFQRRYVPADHFAVAGSPRFVVGLDTELTDELKREGTARELIRHFQELRKRSGLAVEDRIAAWLESPEPVLLESAASHRALVSDEILARSLELAAPGGDNAKVYSARVEVGGAPVRLSIRKA